MTEKETFSLIIPAHNEATVIARCLLTAMRGAPSPDSFEIVVAANGCTDDTVKIARETAPHAIVLDIATGSKTGAINAGNLAASHYPRIVLDADVECDYRSLAALAASVREAGIMTAAPSIRLETAHCNWAIKSYYAAWLKQPYAKSGKGGAGCYALSKAALERVGEFPDIIGDDIWIHTRFPDHEKRMVARTSDGEPVFSTVRPPASAWQQVRVESRRMIGNADVKRDYPSPYFANAKKGGGIVGSLKSGASPIDLAMFYAVKAMVKIQTGLNKIRGSSSIWTRDLSSR
ncbi:glycosyltransferase [Erythrobacter sp. Alg231-14]|uniref:glycosyltransferase n=1 Tax=Erythrobacter sp. Alg231-14 TaxID=1922225 RepID=UPI000D554982